MLKKITFIIPALSMGGAEMQIVYQANELIQRGYSCQVIVLSQDITIKNLLDAKVNIHLIELSQATIGASLIKEHFSVMKKLVNIIKAYQPDDIIASLGAAHFISRRIALKVRAPNLWIYHHSTQYIQAPIDTITKKIFHYWNARVGKNVDYGHIYISKAVQKNIEENFPVKNGHLLYNAIPKRKIDSLILTNNLNKFDLKNEEYIIIPGRLHPVKGHYLFLRSCHDFIKRYKIQIVFAGYGKTKESLEKLIDILQIKHLIKFTGKLENVNLLSLVKSSKFVVIPSLEEGLGNVAIEALMCGKTILSSNAGGLSEVVKHKLNGYVFERNDSDDLLQKFKDLFLNFEQMKIAEERQISYYESHFTIESQVTQLLNIINSQ